MKKIFTLLTLAAAAATVNAQEIWKAVDFDLSNATLETLTENIYAGGNADAPDKSMPGELKSSQILASTTNITLYGVSTPNADKTIETGAAAWQLKGSVDGNDALITDACNPKFAQYLIGQGNPEAVSWYFNEETDNGTAFRVYGIYWEPGDEMPAKGAYWRFDTKSAGKLKIAGYYNNNGNPTYIVDASTKQPIPYNDIDVSIYIQNTGFAWNTDGDVLCVGKMPETYVIRQTNGCTQNRLALGYLTFPVEANKSYYFFNPKSQIGLYGFEFTASDTAIESIIAPAADDDAPIYNILGQRVNNDYKGLVIKNGKKYIQK